MRGYIKLKNTDGNFVCVNINNITTISETSTGCVIRTVNPNEYIESIEYIDTIIGHLLNARS